MKRQVLKMMHKGTFEVIHDSNDKVNPYRIYCIYYTPSECGLRKHKKQIAKYCDMISCLCYLRDLVYMKGD